MAWEISVVYEVIGDYGTGIYRRTWEVSWGGVWSLEFIGNLFGARQSAGACKEVYWGVTVRSYDSLRRSQLEKRGGAGRSLELVGKSFGVGRGACREMVCSCKNL